VPYSAPCPTDQRSPDPKLNLEKSHKKTRKDKEMDWEKNWQEGKDCSSTSMPQFCLVYCSC